jgi:membrane fusion protein (multidrug efflux system)
MKKIYLFILLFPIVFSCSKNNKDAVMPPQPFQVYEIQTKTVPIYQEFVGQIYGEKDIPIRARVVGFLEGIHFKEGEAVKKGQLLYSIDPEPLQQEVAGQESMVAQAQTILVQSESDLKRIEPLAAMSAVSEQELDMATSHRDAAISGLEAAKANLNIAKLNLGYAKMYAPIDGIIGKTMAREGEFVGKDPNPVILNTVSQLSSVRVQFFLTERDYLRVAKEYIVRTNSKVESGKNDKIELQLILADGELYPPKGKVDFIDRNVDSETGSILVQATFPNPDRLIRPGQFARVKIKVREANDAILIPQKCAKELQGQFSVMYVNNENKLESKQVVITDKVGEFYIVEDGLKSGDKIILEGLQKARSGMEIVPEVTDFVSQQTPQS